MTQQFQSQCGEDRWLDANWASLGLPEVGFYIELGAGNGEYLSNTLWLADRGWHGLLIEADPRNIVKPRDNCIIHRSIIGPAGEVSFGLHPTDSYLSGINRKAPERMTAQAVTLSAVLDSHSIDRVDLISIDTEGNEIEVWKTLDLSRWRPQIAIIELYTWKLSDRSREVMNQLQADGYDLIHRTELNGIFRDAR